MGLPSQTDMSGKRHLHTRSYRENPSELAFELNFELSNLIVLMISLVITICELQLNYMVIHPDH